MCAKQGNSLDLSQELTDEISQFRDRIRDCTLNDDSDDYLAKWLVARNYNLDQAETMLRQSLEWRRLNRIDDLLTTYNPPEVLTKYYSIGQCGLDKNGGPVWVSQQGLIDIRGILQSVTKKELVRFSVYIIEKITSRSNRIQHQKTTVIVDVQYMSMRQMTTAGVGEVRNELLKIYEANYPETLRRAYVINAPRIFMVIYNMMKPFMHQVTIDKVRIYGTDKKEWSTALLEDIDASQLPAYYGGTMTDPDGDPKCPSKFNMGGEVPREYYLKNAPPVPREEMKMLALSSGSKEKLEFDVSTVGSVLKWEFMSEGGDIAFHVSRESPDEVVDLVPHGRIDSHLVIEEGQIVCDCIGKYVVEFDNSFSYLKSKKVHYLVAVDFPATI